VNKIVRLPTKLKRYLRNINVKEVKENLGNPRYSFTYDL